MFNNKLNNIDGKSNINVMETKSESIKVNNTFSMNKMTDGQSLMMSMNKNKMDNSIGKCFEVNNNVNNNQQQQMKNVKYNLELAIKNGSKNKINYNVNSVDQLCKILSQESILFVVEQFPDKINEIEQLRKEFDWQMIGALQTDVAWMQWFVNSIKARNSDYTKMLNMNNTDGCIIRHGSKPKICDAFVFFQELGQTPAIDRIFDCNLIDTNSLVHNLSKRLKGYLIELNTIALDFSIGLELSVPKIQEGNNFGVEVLMKATRIAMDIYNISLTHLNILDEYYCERVQILSKMIRHVYIEDYRIVLNRLDKENYYLLCCIVNHLYQNYSMLYDFVIKNLRKLLNPRD